MTVRRAPRWKDQASLDWYDRASLIVWLPLSFVYLAVTLVQLFGRESLGPRLLWFDSIMSVVFLIDYMIRLGLSEDRRAFVRHIWNIADLIVIATPLIAIRFGSDWTGVLRIVRVFRLGMIARRVWNHRGKASRRGQVKWMAVVTIGVVFLAGLTVWSAENAHADSTIKSGWDALWWAIVTMFTVGYGETYPHTAVGKVSAVVLMVAGIALFTWLTATMASLFLESGKEARAESQRFGMLTQINAIYLRLQSLDGEGTSAGAGKTGEAALLHGAAEKMSADVAAFAEAEQGDAGAAAEAREEVAVLWREWAVWGSIRHLGTHIKSTVRRIYRRESFWFWVCMLVYVVSIAQATTAHDGFWPPAGVTIALFALALCTRFSVQWTGWVQLALVFALAFALGGEAVNGTLAYLIVIVAICLGAMEFVALVRNKPSESGDKSGDETRSLPGTESQAVDAIN